MTEQEVAHWQQIIDADPRWQQLIAKYFGPDAQMGGLGGSLRESVQLQAEARAMGLPMPPDDLHFGSDGRLTPDESLPWWAAPAVLGGAVAAPFVAPLLGVGGAASPAGSGAAGGLTPAMTAVPPAITSQGVSQAAGGGFLSSILGNAGQLAPILGDAAGGFADNRRENNSALGWLYNAQTNAARDQYDADRRNYEYSRDAPDVRARQAARGDLLANVQDVQIQRPAGSTIPTFSYTGGLRPSALGPNARAAGSEMSRQALLKLMEGESLPQYEAPTLPTLNTGSVLEDILGGASLGLGVWDAVRR